jgi:type I restriction enzyme, S subunit
MNLLRLRFGHNYIQPHYAHFFMQSDFFREEVRKRVGHAVNQVSINQKNLAAVPFLFPPLAEQRRIVAKLEKLLGSVDAYQQRLAKIPMVLKRFRQAVLAAACSGRLTADWREEHTDVEHMFSLIQEIDTDNQNDLPETWEIVSVGDTISGLKYGTSQKCSYEKGGTPVLRIPNIGEGVIDQSDLKYADLPANELEQLKLQPGDVLLIRSNGSVSLVGRVALVRECERGFAYAGYLIRLRPITSRILPPYLNLVLGIHDVRLQIEIPARSTSGVNNINSDEVKALKIPLPPLAEQAEIVRHIETLFKLVDQIEARYQRAKPLVDKLPQSILAKAFRGELVPTEAELARREGRDYERASALLERIRSERAEHAQGRKEKVRSQPRRVRMARDAKPNV